MYGLPCFGKTWRCHLRHSETFEMKQSLRGVTQFFIIPRGENLFSKGKVTNLKISGFFSGNYIHSISSTPPSPPALPYPVWIGLFQRNPKRGGWGHTFLKKSPGMFKFVILPLEVLENTSFHPWNSWKALWHRLEIPRPKTKTHRISTWVFFNTPGNSTSILVDLWNFHLIVFQNPWRFNVLNPTPPHHPLVCFFLK